MIFPKLFNELASSQPLRKVSQIFEAMEKAASTRNIPTEIHFESFNFDYLFKRITSQYRE